MKILISVQKWLRVLGIQKPEPNCNRFTLKRLLILYTFTHVALSATSFFLTEAKTFQEITYSLYAAATSTLYVCCFSLLIFHMERIFKLIENLESIIETRKFDFTILFQSMC